MPKADIYFKYATRSAGWGLAAQATVDPNVDATPRLFVDANEGKPYQNKMGNEEFYQRYESMGMPGRGFVRAIQGSRLHDSEACSTLSLNFDAATYRLGAQPGFLDAVIQPAFMMLDASADAPYMTTALKGVVMYRPLSRDKTYSLHNRLLSVGDAQASHFSTSWTVYDSNNHVCIDCQTARLQKIAHKAEEHAPSEILLQEAGSEALLLFIADRLDTSPEKVRTNVPLPELGVDSLMMMRIRAMMDKLNKPVHDLFNLTVGDLLDMIGDEHDREKDQTEDFQRYGHQVRRTLKPYSREKQKWFRGRTGSSSRLRLYCFPYGHLSSPVIFKNWVGQFADHIEVVPVEMPGHGDRIDESPIESAAEIAETLSSILGEELHHPFALFGHSSGALIAYAWALHLQKSKQPLPEKLIVSAFTAPTITPNPVIRMAAQDYEKGGIHHIPTLSEILDPANDTLVGKIITLHHQSTREMGLIDLPPDFIAAQLHAIAAIMRTVSTFDPAAIVPLSIPVVACHGENDLQVSYGDTQAWQTLTTGSFSMPVFPGDHLFIHPDQSEALVMSAILEMLHG
jgi:surfactin synthase thioesterase subunit